jgi:methylated-DNA-[protein]-cysteine S-methyltransferase
MRIAYHVMSAPGPLGLLFLARTERGLRYLEFLDRRSIRRAIESHREDNPNAEWQASLLELKPVVDQLEAYFCGANRTLHVELDPVGSEFELTVWNALLEIPYGETRSYGQIAKAIGQPKASRAVGLANNHNPLAIVVPCHRVIGADGSLTGYGGGLPRKRWLLAHERHFASLAGETLDLFAGVTSAAVNRIASGEGPPLGTQRVTLAAVRAANASAAEGPAEPARPTARATPAAARRTPEARPAGRRTAPARIAARNGARSAARTSRPLVRNAARSAASKAGRGSGRAAARSTRPARKSSR